MRATLDSIGFDDATVWVADSFRGFPVVDRRNRGADQWGEIDYLAVSLEEVQANFARLGFDQGVRFVPGFFAETLPGLAGHRWSLVRLDGDTYEATSVALESLYPGLSIGGYLIVDDYGALAECRRAVDEFRARYGLDEPIERVDWTCVRWRRARAVPEPSAEPAPGSEATPAQEATSAQEATPGPTVQRSVERAHERVPTLRELALIGELEAARGRLAQTEAGRALWRRILARRRSS